ncbi:acetate--CoA ligase [Candidatus Woesearchaeota archaeon]|nr:acetate--CoA ligase [Candidatus Woesearchaeota archaeon]
MVDKIKSMATEKREFPPPEDFQSNAHVSSMEQYNEEHKKSIDDPDSYWREKAEQLDWFEKKDSKIYFWDPENVVCKWFEGWKLNVSYNCLDRHLKDNGDKTAIIWQGEPEEDKREFTYNELHKEVCRMANALKSLGVKKGDRVAVYLPMIPELAISLLACSRIGAVHSVVFAAYSAHALKDRIEDSEAKVLITSDGSYRKGKVHAIKEEAEKALDKGCQSIKNVIVVKRTGNDMPFKEGRDIWWNDLRDKSDEECEPERMDAEDMLFILYTSGTTGKPKGVVHTNGGYLLYAYQTFKWVFDIRDEDIYWCTADVCWITGHSYIVYGPLANCATTVMFEGVPDYPEPDRFWKIVEDLKVSIFYTAPTAIRALSAHGAEWPEKHDLSSLRLLGSVGEPINPEAWMWYHKHIGNSKCPIVDTWWQTETGGIMITPLPGAMTLKPGSACRPFPGVVPAVLKKDGSETEAGQGGYLVIKQPWPGMLRDVFKDHERYKEAYFGKYPGMYFTGDGAKKDEDGDFWIVGRIDDVINVSGHRIGTAEIESALVAHKDVAEAAVVPFPHEVKGSGVYAFVTINRGVEETDELKQELVESVAEDISKIARPDKIQFAPQLPKTRSGKIMRRILRKIAEGSDELGDTSTLADASVVDDLLRNRL